MAQNVSKNKELLVEQMKDLLNAENQLVKALPKMSKAAHNPELQKAFTEHLKQTEGHVSKLEKAFGLLDQQAKSRTCNGMKGLIEEGEETIDEGKKLEEPQADIALIAAAQKVEHYEMSGYGTVRTIAESIGKQDVASLMEQIEQEEEKADALLTEIASPLLRE
jgi:ferritin-like metal-binding protein YciE